uniref:DEAD-box helicase OB fold domain-containing protein n=1 Tax=Meloidogyne incognita TaxID=6306 RepID=A0A914MSU5_MELIC
MSAPQAKILRILEGQEARFLPFSAPQAKILRILEGQEAVIRGVAHLERSLHYVTARENQIVSLHPSSTLKHQPEWALYNEFVFTSQNFIRIVTDVRPEWLIEFAPDYFDENSFPEGSDAKRILNVKRNKFTKEKSK